MSDKLLSGQLLYPEQTLISPGGHGHLHYQNDGNLVSYLDDVPHWASQTAGHSARFLHMDPNGNLVLWGADGPIASTRTEGHPGAMVQVQDDANFVIYEDPNGPLAGTPIWASTTHEFTVGDCVITPPPEKTRRPLIGPLRVVNKLVADDTGYRRVFGDSEFILLRLLKTDPAKYQRSREDCKEAGYQVRRMFAEVGGWMDYWCPAYGVYPRSFTPWFYDGNIMRPSRFGPPVTGWSDWEQLFRQALRDARADGVRLHITFGDRQIIMPTDFNLEVAFHDHVSRIVAEEGGWEVCALYELCNEVPMNWPGGYSDATVAQMGRCIAAARANLPHVLFAQGAALSEEPDMLYMSATHGDVCTEHTVRSPLEKCIKHTMGLILWEGNYRAFPLPFWQGEPAGPNIGPNDNVGDDVYQPMNDPASLVALYFTHAVTGQPSMFFDGASVRGLGENTDAWGYDELPALLEKHCPEDIATWDHAANGAVGGIMYWFRGLDFVAPIIDGWNPTPPRPVASWTLLKGNDEISGTGAPPRGTGALVGKFVQ